MRQTDRWAFLDEESDLDEEADDARQEASELREQANGLTRFAERMPEGKPQFEKYREALSMYRRADSCITRNAAGRKLPKHDRELVLQCRLNAACLSLKLGDERSTEESCKAATEVDPQNPHMALFQARLATLQCKRDLAEKWEERARCWAKARDQELSIPKVQTSDVQSKDNASIPKVQASDVQSKDKASIPKVQASDVQSKDNARDAMLEKPQAQTPSVARLVQEGVALFKQKRIPEAEDVLKRAIYIMDQKEKGGPIERIAARAPRALAFNALEALSEVHASVGRWTEAISCGQRAVELLDEGEFEVPFSTPEFYRREGHLCFSMGYVTAATGGDPLPTWRRAANALRKHGGDLSTEGVLLLKIGLELVNRNHAAPGKVTDVDECIEAVTALEHAADRFKRARARLAKEPEGLKQPAIDYKSSEFARQELEACAILARLFHEMCEIENANSVLDSSAGLLELAPANGTDVDRELAETWADHCGLWALTANKVRRLEESERAIIIQCRLLREAGCQKPEMEALRALAVVRRQQRNEAGVEEALSSLEVLAPEEERARVAQNMRNRLHQVGPAIEPDVPSQDAPVAASKARCWRKSYFFGALCCAFVAVVVGAMLHNDAFLTQSGIL